MSSKLRHDENGWLFENPQKEERKKYEELIFNVFVTGLSGLLG